AGPRKTRDEPSSNRVERRQHHDRDRSGRLLGSTRCLRAVRQDYVDLESHQFGREAWKELVPPGGMSGLDGDVLSLNVAAFAQSFFEDFDAPLLLLGPRSRERQN